MDYKYDVFISYSRKDFVDEYNNIIPGNAVSAITEAFDKNDITYWIDREGIKSGQPFRDEIINAIADSKVFLFVSSFNSNKSDWTKKEILEASDSGKYIIPFKIDDCEYDRSVRFELRPLDFIEYFNDKDGAINKLVSSVNNHKEELAMKELELQFANQKAELTQKIESLEKDFRANDARQDVALKEIMDIYAKLGVQTKRCPVCEKEIQLATTFCDRCGWHFAALPNNEVNKEELRIIKTNWEIINSASISKEEFQTLKNKIYDLKEALKAAEDEKKIGKETIAKLEEESGQLRVQLTEIQSCNEDLAKQHEALSEQCRAAEQELKEIKDREATTKSTGIRKDNLTNPAWIKERIIPLCYNNNNIIFSSRIFRQIYNIDEFVDYQELVALMSFYGIDVDMTDLNNCKDEDEVANAVVNATIKKRIEATLKTIVKRKD